MNGEDLLNAHHSLVSDMRDFSAVGHEILSSLLNSLEDRFSADASLNLEPLAQIDQNVSDEQLKDCHESLVPDLDLCQFCLQYREAAHTLLTLKLASDPSAAVKYILHSGTEMTELSTALARFLVVRPHSADAERLIRSYNLIKNVDRARIGARTMKNYLYIQHNIPIVEEFDPHPAVLLWLKDKERPDVKPEKACAQKWFRTMFAEAEYAAKDKQKTQNEKIGF